MSGSEAILVLQEARQLAGEPEFNGSRAEAIRFACVRLDAASHDAVELITRICPMERLLAKLANQVPSQRYNFRQRMLADFDAAIAGLLDVAKSRRNRIGVMAANDADNWAGQSQAEKDLNWGRLFPQAVEEARRKVHH